MDTTVVTEPLNIASGSLDVLILVYAVWLIYSGSPIWTMRARPVGTRPVVLQDNWFRVPGGVYIAGFLLGWITPGFASYDWIVYLLAAIPYLIGLWKSLAPKVL